MFSLSGMYEIGASVLSSNMSPGGHIRLGDIVKIGRDGGQIGDNM